jgi:hypothetical protein
MSSPAKLRLYAVSVHWSAAGDAPMSRRIVSSAVVTTSRSRATMNEATEARARMPVRPRGIGRGGPVPVPGWRRPGPVSGSDTVAGTEFTVGCSLWGTREVDPERPPD